MIQIDRVVKLKWRYIICVYMYENTHAMHRSDYPQNGRH